MGEETEEHTHQDPSHRRSHLKDVSMQRSVSTSETDPFVCPPCSSRFRTKERLVEHWARNRDCFNERLVNNPLQTKYGERMDGVPYAPGEEVLRRIRARDCEHPTSGMKPWRDRDGEVRGLQCSYCYTIIPQEM